jgi:hypothetical protein
MSKYSNQLIKAGVKLTEILFVGLFDNVMKSVSVGELRKGVSELEELLKCTGVNVVVDATGAFEKNTYYPHYIFRKTFNRDVSKWKSLGVLEDKLTEDGEVRKFVCGVRVDTIVREKESNILINSEFKLNVKDFNIVFIKDIDSAKKAFKDIAESQKIYGDLETNTLRFEHKNARILTVAWTPQHKPLTSYVFAYDHPKVSVTKEYQEFIQKNVYALMTKRNTVFHNGLFDLKFISRFFKVNPFDTNMDDTFVIARILKNNTLSSDERRESVSLKTLAFHLVGDWEVPLQRKQAEIIKEKGISKDEFDYSMYEVEDLVLYAGIDTSISTAVNAAITGVVDGAPTTFDTLREIAEWIENDGVAATDLASAIAGKADRTELSDYATVVAMTQLEGQVSDGLSNKVDKEAGKGLSTNDFTASYKDQLDNMTTTVDTQIDNKFNNVYGPSIEADFEGINTQLGTKLNTPTPTAPSATVPSLVNSLPLYTLGNNGEYVLCTPDTWFLINGFYVPGYAPTTLGV